MSNMTHKLIASENISESNVYNENITVVGGDNGEFISLGDNPNYVSEVYAGNGDDNISAGAGVQWVYGYGGDDVINVGGDNDAVDGGEGNDTIEGGYGDDYLSGGAGADSLHGGAGADTIYGGDGNDDIRANEGADNIYGGAGADYYASHEGNWLGDTIHDYELGEKLHIQYDMDTDVAPDVGRIDIVETATAGTYKLSVDGTEYSTLIAKDAVSGMTFTKEAVRHGPTDYNNKFHYTIDIESSEGSIVPPGTLEDTNTDNNVIVEGSSIGDLVGITAEAGDGAVYSLTDDANGRFAIDADTGVVSVANELSLDYELSQSHEIVV